MARKMAILGCARRGWKWRRLQTMLEPGCESLCRGSTMVNDYTTGPLIRIWTAQVALTGLRSVFATASGRSARSSVLVDG